MEDKETIARTQAICGVIHTNLHQDPTMQSRMFGDISNNIARLLKKFSKDEIGEELHHELVMAAMILAGLSIVVSEKPEDNEMVAAAIIDGLQRGYTSDAVLKIKEKHLRK